MQKAPTATRLGAASNAIFVMLVFDGMPSTDTSRSFSRSCTSFRAEGRLSTSKPASINLDLATPLMFSSNRAFKDPPGIFHDGIKVSESAKLRLLLGGNFCQLLSS